MTCGIGFSLGHSLSASRVWYLGLSFAGRRQAFGTFWFSVRVPSLHIFSYLRAVFFCPLVKFNSCYFHAQVLGTALLHEFNCLDRSFACLKVAVMIIITINCCFIVGLFSCAHFNLYILTCAFAGNFLTAFLWACCYLNDFNTTSIN